MAIIKIGDNEYIGEIGVAYRANTVLLKGVGTQRETYVELYEHDLPSLMEAVRFFEGKHSTYGHLKCR